MSVRRKASRLSAGLLLVAACAIGPTAAFAEESGASESGGEDPAGSDASTDCALDPDDPEKVVPELALSADSVEIDDDVSLTVRCFPERGTAEVSVVEPDGHVDTLDEDEGRSVTSTSVEVWEYTPSQSGTHSFQISEGGWSNNVQFTVPESADEDDPQEGGSDDEDSKDEGSKGGDQKDDGKKGDGADEDAVGDGSDDGAGDDQGDPGADDSTGGDDSSGGQDKGPDGDSTSGGAAGSGSTDGSGSASGSDGDGADGSDGDGSSDSSGSSDNSGSSGTKEKGSSGSKGSSNGAAEDDSDKEPAPSAAGDPAQGSRPAPPQPPEQPGSATDDFPSASPDPTADQEQSAALAALMTSLFANGVSSGQVGTSPEDARTVIDPSADASQIEVPAGDEGGTSDGGGSDGSSAGGSEPGAGADEPRAGADDSDDDELAATGTNALATAALAGLAILGGAGRLWWQRGSDR